jgi:hypothetical protein
MVIELVKNYDIVTCKLADKSQSGRRRIGGSKSNSAHELQQFIGR